mmetsp:Transcript_30174/g.39753  ORF Transcript_30174/g.39753 Transcript_30174/m.39753 type:complete len:416 (-) Transcript_30174:442-1689(-)|eukprot:CAMPEP_0117754602 /NCGR_PEP_ID=MMETSP0947-20121206/12921_1 /TAXON_ID=44440 /ORGANISM="Chattonella subsalsa, Strain CCMP2191" /LENGTH=415 /DNA_ID=CAMNT_0005573711 /DNA_START=117 /DNA_END=1364 /DNA_ORIENTATION=+
MGGIIGSKPIEPNTEKNGKDSIRRPSEINVSDNPFLKFDKESEFLEKYTIGKKVGEGGFAVVHQCTEKATEKQYAAKIVNRHKLDKQEEEDLHREVAILKMLKHKHIVYLHEYIEEQTHYILVQEFMAGGELFDRICEKTVYNEKEARDVVITLLHAICYCHDRRVAHRDLKPENMLLMIPNDDESIKIADFGLAIQLPEDSKGIDDPSGTPQYVAPQVLTGELYGVEADIWSLGVITYILLGGYPPFSEENEADLFQKIIAGRFHFHSKYWSEISEDAKDLISKMIVVDKNERITAKEALEHPWILEADHVLEAKDLKDNHDELKKFNARRRIRKAANVVKLVAAWTPSKPKSTNPTLTNMLRQASLESAGGNKSFKHVKEGGDGQTAFVAVEESELHTIKDAASPVPVPIHSS